MRVSVTYYKKAVINTEYKDSIIRDIFIDIFSEKPKYKNNSAYCEFCIHYSTYTVSEISWNEISDFVKTVRASKFALMFIYKLLEQNLYKNEFADLFYKNMSFFDINSYKKNDPLYWLFCGEAVATIINYSYVSGRVLLSNTSKKNYEDMPYVDERMRIIIHEIFKII